MHWDWDSSTKKPIENGNGTNIGASQALRQRDLCWKMGIGSPPPPPLQDRLINTFINTRNFIHYIFKIKTKFAQYYNIKERVKEHKRVISQSKVSEMMLVSQGIN